ncbi:Uncharacterised protein [Burkholderia cenocepacia]|nr:Uncharacterised protein [Burkholderia cenocepacia]
MISDQMSIIISPLINDIFFEKFAYFFRPRVFFLLENKYAILGKFSCKPPRITMIDRKIRSGAELMDFNLIHHTDIHHTISQAFYPHILTIISLYLTMGSDQQKTLRTC